MAHLETKQRAGLAMFGRFKFSTSSDAEIHRTIERHLSPPWWPGILMSVLLLLAFLGVSFLTPQVTWLGKVLATRRANNPAEWYSEGIYMVGSLFLIFALFPALALAKSRIPPAVLEQLRVVPEFDRIQWILLTPGRLMLSVIILGFLTGFWIEILARQHGSPFVVGGFFPYYVSMGIFSLVCLGRADLIPWKTVLVGEAVFACGLPLITHFSYELSPLMGFYGLIVGVTFLLWGICTWDKSRAWKKPTATP